MCIGLSVLYILGDLLGLQTKLAVPSGTVDQTLPVSDNPTVSGDLVLEFNR